MSDKTSDKDQQLNISDVDLAKIAAALLGVEYPGDEYFDGSKTVENKSTVATSMPEIIKSEENLPSQEILPEVNYTERVRSTPFRKQSYSAYQSARLRNFAKAGIIDTNIVEDDIVNEESLQVEEGVITINDILGGEEFNHEPDLLNTEDVENQAFPDTLAPTYDIEKEYGPLDEEEQFDASGEINLVSEDDIELNANESKVVVENIDQDEVEYSEIESVEEGEIELSNVDSGDEGEIFVDEYQDVSEDLSQNITPVIPVVVPVGSVGKVEKKVSAQENREEIDLENYGESEVEIEDAYQNEDKFDLDIETIKPVKRSRVVYEDIREITVCEKKNKVKTSDAPKMPEFIPEKPTYFAFIDPKPKKIRKTGNAPHIIPNDSKPVEFTPKGGKYREI